MFFGPSRLVRSTALDPIRLLAASPIVSASSTALIKESGSSLSHKYPLILSSINCSKLAPLQPVFADNTGQINRDFWCRENF